MSDDTITVEVVGSQFRYDREQYTHGDELEVTQRTLESHPNTLAPVTAGDAGAETSDDSDDDQDEGDQDDEEIEPLAESELDPHPSELTVDELEERIADVDDLELLYGILAAEGDNKNRDTAIAAIESQIGDVEE